MNHRFIFFRNFRDIFSLMLFLVIYLAVSVLLVFVSVKNHNTDSSCNYAASYDNKPVIIIDPGHGGIDGGAVSRTGILETDINLVISRYIYDYCNLSGLECILTRNEDTML